MTVYRVVLVFLQHKVVQSQDNGVISLQSTDLSLKIILTLQFFGGAFLSEGLHL